MPSTIPEIRSSVQLDLKGPVRSSPLNQDHTCPKMVRLHGRKSVTVDDRRSAVLGQDQPLSQGPAATGDIQLHPQRPSIAPNLDPCHSILVCGEHLRGASVYPNGQV